MIPTEICLESLQALPVVGSVIVLAISPSRVTYNEIGSASRSSIPFSHSFATVIISAVAVATGSGLSYVLLINPSSVRLSVNVIVAVVFVSKV